jgi:two-component system nitrogen regulation sensor histidine kinase GlnL
MKSVSRLSRSPNVPDGRFDHVIESLEEGVIAVDASRRIQAMNQAAEHLTGSSLASTREHPYRQAFERNPWIADLIDEVMESDQGTIRAAGEILGVWGRTVSVRATASPVLDSRGARTGAVLVLHDVSLARGLDADAERATSLEHLGAMVAGLAHEIKNPLSGIRGAVQLLGVEVQGNPRAPEYIALVVREVDRLTKLLEQLLELGSRGRSETVAVNVHQAIEHVLALVDDEARQAGVRLVRLFDPSLPPVAGHVDSLIQVFLNLVQNALQALATAPPAAAREVRVTTRFETSYHVNPGRGPERGRGRLLRVDVEDTGPGVPEADQPSLFSPFFTTKPKGTGLGLTVSHRIVTDHGGTIRCESQPGRTVFRVILPVWEGERS